MPDVLPSRRRLIPIFLAQGIGLACGLLGVRVVSRLIPPDTLGAYGLFLTFTTLGVTVVHAGLIKFVGRHWAAAPDRTTLRRTLLTAWSRKLPWLALAALLGALSLAQFSAWTTLALLAPLFLAAALLSLVALAQAALQAERAHWRDCGVSATASILRTFAAPALFLVAGATGLPWGFCLHAAVAAALGAWFLRPSLHSATFSDASPASALPAFYDGALFTILALAGWALLGANRWIVAWRFGETATGLFTLAGNAALIAPSVLGTIFLQYFQPNFFALGDRATTDSRAQLARDVDRAALSYTTLAAVAVALLTAIAPWLVGPLIGETYRAALVWIFPSGCFGIAAGTSLFYHSLLLSGRREPACALVDLTNIAALIGGGLLAAAISATAFRTWLIATPLIPWLVARPLARRYFFMPVSTPAPAPAR